jgi:tetratricopeptide (TPR) repeat protein
VVAAEPRATAPAIRILWVALALLALARLALAFVPSTWGWGLNALRFVEPIGGWVGWAVMAAALVPALAGPLVPAAARLGDAIGGRSPLPLAAAAAFGAALVLALPDRVRFVGDFLLRQGTVEALGLPALLYPQALPLDVALHHTLPVWLAGAGILDANTGARAFGALGAALLAALSVTFARVLRLRGIAALAASGIVFFGGYLGLFTGYSKALADLVVVVVFVGVFGLRAIRGQGGLLPLGVALALGFALHRSALGLLPAAALVWTFWLRERAKQVGGWLPVLRAPATIAALLIPLAVLAAMLPRMITTAFGFDAVHFASADVRAAGGVWKAAFAGTRLADLLDLVWMLSPLGLLAPVLAAALGRRVALAREPLLLLALAVPLVGVWFFVHPIHGVFRDWDVFAFGAAALSLAAGWAAGETLREAPVERAGARRSAVLGGAVLAAVAVPALQWLSLSADIDRGLARVLAFVSEPPARTPAERGDTWDYLGIRYAGLGRWSSAAEAFARAAETAPSPRVLVAWAMAETQRGDLRAAQRLYWKLLAKNPDNARAWLALSAVSSRLGDMHESRYAAQRLLEVSPNAREAEEIIRFWDSLPAGTRDSLNWLYPPRDSAARGW